MIFTLYNQETQKKEVFSTAELLEMINRDRSDEWSEYDEEDSLISLEEAINEFCSPYTTNPPTKEKNSPEQHNPDMWLKENK